MSGQRPEVKVYLKRKEGEFTDLCAFWRNENGMLSGRFDRRVRAIKVVDNDGKEHVLRMTDKGFVEGAFLNIRMDDQRGGGGRQQSRGGQSQRGRQEQADDSTDDDIPF